MDPITVFFNVAKAYGLWVAAVITLSYIIYRLVWFMLTDQVSKEIYDKQTSQQTKDTVNAIIANTDSIKAIGAMVSEVRVIINERLPRAGG